MIGAGRRVSRRTVLGGIALGGFAALPLATGARGAAAQGDGAATPGATPASGTRTVEHLYGTAEIPANPQRVIALGEEWLLADLLDFGIRPIASSASFADGFIGFEPEEIEGIVSFASTDFSVEQLIELRPDLIVITDFYASYVEGLYDLLSEVAPTVVPFEDPDDYRTMYRSTASFFGKDDIAEARIAEAERAFEEARADLALEGRTFSVATVYPGAPSVTLWLDDSVAATEMGTALGLELRPDPEGYDITRGRATISLERVREIDGETLIMLQIESVPEEQATYEEVVSDPLWRTIPAVQDERVFVLNRIGEPGNVRGRLWMIGEFRRMYETGA